MNIICWCGCWHNPKQVVVLLNSIHSLESITISAFGLALQFDLHISIYLAFVLRISPGSRKSRSCFFRFDVSQALWPLHCLATYKVLFSWVFLWLLPRSWLARFLSTITFRFTTSHLLVTIVSGSLSL